MSWCPVCRDEFENESGICPTCDAVLQPGEPPKRKFGEGVSFMDTQRGRAWQAEDFVRVWEGPYELSEPIVRALERATVPHSRADGTDVGRCSVVVASSYVEEALEIVSEYASLNPSIEAPDDLSGLRDDPEGYFFDQPWVRYAFAAVALLLVVLLVATQ